MGAVSFRNVVRNPFERSYYHDFHGWRNTMETATRAFNAFIAEADEYLAAVSLFTATDNVAYTVTIYDDFTAGELMNPLHTQSGSIGVTGYHTVDLQDLVALYAGNDFYIEVSLSDGGHAFDCTSEIPVLLGAPAVTDGSVVSDAQEGESFYFDIDGSQWVDLQGYYLYDAALGREVTGSANFTIKGFTVVPEPHAFGILALGLLAAAIRRRPQALTRIAHPKTHSAPDR